MSLFDLDDRYEDDVVVGHAINRRDGVLLSVVVHSLLIVAILLTPDLALFKSSPEELEAQRQALLKQQQPERERRFVFVDPRVDLKALEPPLRADLSDMDRQARTRERASESENPMPFSRGNSPEPAEAAPEERAKSPDLPIPPNEQPLPPARRTSAQSARSRQRHTATTGRSAADVGRLGGAAPQSRAVRTQSNLQQPEGRLGGSGLDDPV